MITLVLMAIGCGVLVGDIKEFFFKGGATNDLAYILFRMIFTVLFVESTAFLLILNKYLKYNEKALAIQSKENIKIENHTHETIMLPEDKEAMNSEIAEPAFKSELPSKTSRGRSSKKTFEIYEREDSIDPENEPKKTRGKSKKHK